MSISGSFSSIGVSVCTDNAVLSANIDNNSKIDYILYISTVCVLISVCMCDGNTNGAYRVI